MMHLYSEQTRRMGKQTENMQTEAGLSDQIGFRVGMLLSDLSDGCLREIVKQGCVQSCGLCACVEILRPHLSKTGVLIEIGNNVANQVWQHSMETFLVSFLYSKANGNNWFKTHV